MTGLKTRAPFPSIAEKFNKAFGDTSRVGIDENGRMATIVPHHMVVSSFGKTCGCNATDIQSAVPSEHTHEEEYHVDGKLAWDPVVRKTCQIPDYFILPLPALSGGIYPIAVKIDYNNARSEDAFHVARVQNPVMAIMTSPQGRPTVW